MILDEPGMNLPGPAPIRQDWIVSFSDLIALMLTFFVVLFSMSTSDPSKVESAVSSLTEQFAKSAIESDLGIITSQTGTVILDQEYIDAVVSTLKGRDTAGQIKSLRAKDGTLIVRMDRKNIFLPRTGVLSAEGQAMMAGIAAAMLRRDSGIGLAMAEIRIVGDAKEFADNAAEGADETPVMVRQASRVARALIASKVPSSALVTVLQEGEEPGLVMAFYTIAPFGKTKASGSDPS
ncbi:MAG TPA: flagellar motor protein MotB [Alphaproteobacteria bacterium]|nr:flagellar motor protein MotB [Alphaproteobacteria bacterium]